MAAASIEPKLGVFRPVNRKRHRVRLKKKPRPFGAHRARGSYARRQARPASVCDRSITKHGCTLVGPPKAEALGLGCVERLRELRLASLCGVAQPWRTSQVDRSCPTTLQRAAKSLVSPPCGSVQVTARERMKRMSAARALAPQGQDLPPPSCRSRRPRAHRCRSSLITTVPVGRSPRFQASASRTPTLK